MRTSSRLKTRLAAACVVSTLTAWAVPFARADDAPKPGPTATATATAAAAAPASQAAESIKPKLLPEVNVKDIALPDLIDFLRDVDPSFQAVVAYDPGASRGEPKIQELRLRNVTTEAVMELLSQTYPQIHSSVAPSGDDKGKIYMIRVEAVPQPPGTPGFSRGGGGGGGGDALFGGAGPEGSRAPAVVTIVHRLREIVDDIAPANGGDAERKKALESIVSLVQATLETSEAGATPKAKAERKADVLLKLHEGTETLIFHGTPEQAMLIQQALDTLQPRADRADGRVNTRQLDAQVRRLNDRLTSIEKRVGAQGMEGDPNGPTTRPAPGAEKK